MLIISLRLYLSNFSIIKMSLPSPPILSVFWTQRGSVNLHLLEDEELLKLFEILCRFLPFSPFICLIIYLYQYGLMGIYFVLQNIIQHYILPIKFSHSALISGLLCYFVLLPLFCVLSTSLFPGTSRWYTPGIFPPPVLQLAISPGRFGSFFFF